MKKEDILREELVRMRQLMGMNGSLYQKPIMEDESREHGDERPDPADYKGGEENPKFKEAFKHWQKEHQRPPSPPAPKPKPPAPPSPKKGATSTTGREGKAYTPKKGTSSKKIGDGQFILPISAIPRFGGSKFGTKAKSTRAKTKKLGRTS